MSLAFLMTTEKAVMYHQELGRWSGTFLKQVCMTVRVQTGPPAHPASSAMAGVVPSGARQLREHSRNCELSNWRKDSILQFCPAEHQSRQRIPWMATIQAENGNNLHCLHSYFTTLTTLHFTSLPLTTLHWLYTSLWITIYLKKLSQGHLGGSGG